MPATSKEPTPEQYTVIDALNIDVEKGIIYKNGKPAGTSRPKDGRWIIDIYTGGGICRRFMRYNIIWYRAHGEWPKENLDHDDRDCTNDALSNLKPKTQSANMFNSVPGVKKAPTDTLPRGVHFHKHAKLYRAYINVEGKEKHLGYFKLSEDAHKARRAAEIKYYGEYSK